MSRLPTPCRYPGCPRLKEPSIRYCPQHAAVVAADYASGKIRVGRLPDGAWQQLRRAVIALHEGYCDHCGVPGATDVDHIIGLAQGGTNDVENLTLLCRSCHATKTRKSGEVRTRGPLDLRHARNSVWAQGRR